MLAIGLRGLRLEGVEARRNFLGSETKKSFLPMLGAFSLRVEYLIGLRGLCFDRYMRGRSTVVLALGIKL